MRYWLQSTRNVIVATAPSTVALASRGTWIPKAYLFADRSNTTFVCVGPKTLICKAAARPNSTETQLDPGRGMAIWVDDPDNEAFDLGDYWCASDSALVSQIVYVTTYNFRPAGA